MSETVSASKKWNLKQVASANHHRHQKAAANNNEVLHVHIYSSWIKYMNLLRWTSVPYMHIC